MLVLTRKYQEKIKIGDNITITVLRMKGKAVRLGIEAPTNVPVIRGELSFMDNDTEQSAEVESVEVEIGTAGDDGKTHGRTFGRAAGKDACWETNSRSLSAAPGNEEPATVGFTRMPRGKVAAAIPKFVGGSAPLRSMM